MDERYREAVDSASTMFADALLADIPYLLEQGLRLDRFIMDMLRAVGLMVLSVVYRTLCIYLAERAKGNGDVEDVLADFTRLQATKPHDRLRRLIAHLTRFADAVHYAEYKERGWPIGSGEIESAHRYVPQERLQIAGACWHP